VDVVAETDAKGNALAYSSQVYVHDKLIAEWIGPNKKKAQENAAAQAYALLLAWK
jgi:dsRNA-specific ribonuclease